MFLLQQLAQAAEQQQLQPPQPQPQPQEQAIVVGTKKARYR